MDLSEFRRRRRGSLRTEDGRRGLRVESRTVNAVNNSPGPKPCWFIRMRGASEYEDMNGFDAFAEIDLGIVPMQIKIKQSNVTAWRRKYPWKKDTVLGIAIPERLSQEEIREKVFLRLWQWRLKMIMTQNNQRTE